MVPSPSRRSRRAVLRMGASVVAAAALAACGRDPRQEPAFVPAGESVPLLDALPGTDGARGGALSLGAAGEERRDGVLRSLVYSQLVAVDPRSGLVYGDLARALELPDPLTLIFTLRPELRFHPDGEGLAAALTAEDVRRDFQARAGAGEHLFSDVVEAVEAPDQRTVVLRLRGRFSQLLEALGDPAAGAVRSRQRSAVTGQALGSGPLAPAARDGGVVLLGRNQLFHRAALPLLDGAAVMLLEDERALAGAFARGELDVYAPAGAEDGDEDGRSDAVTRERPAFAMTGLGLSMLGQRSDQGDRAAPAFQDVRVRRAVFAALDRGAILRQAGGVAAGPVGPAHGADALPAAEVAAHPLYQHDPAEARRLLLAAGWPNLGFRLQASTRTHVRALAELLEDQLAGAGFAPRLQLLEPADWAASFHDGDFEATLFELEGLRTPDLWLRLHTSVGVDGNFSPWGYSSPVYDAAVREALVETDPSLRAEQARRAQRLLLDEGPAMLPLSVPLERVSLARRVGGYRFDAYGFNESWLVARWSVEDAEAAGGS